MTAPDFDPQDPAFVRDPYPTLARLQEAAPVFWSERMGGWVATRYDDIRAAFRDPRLSSDRIRPFVRQLRGELADIVKPLGDNLALWAVFNDPPDHTRLRALMNKAFTSRAVEGLRPNVAEIVNGLVDAILARGAREFDFIKDFAYPLPATVIADMLGVPRAELRRFEDATADLVVDPPGRVNGIAVSSRAKENTASTRAQLTSSSDTPIWRSATSSTA